MINDFVEKIEDLLMLAQICIEFLRLAWQLQKHLQPFWDTENNYGRTWNEFYCFFLGEGRQQQQQQQNKSQEAYTCAAQA